MKTGNIDNSCRRFRTLTLHIVFGFFAICFATARPTGAQPITLPARPSVPAFPNADLKQEPAPTIPNWERIGLQKTLAASYRRCGPEMLEVNASTLGYKGGLGGDYWKVPMPVQLTGMGRTVPWSLTTRLLLPL